MRPDTVSLGDVVLEEGFSFSQCDGSFWLFAIQPSFLLAQQSLHCFCMMGGRRSEEHECEDDASSKSPKSSFFLFLSEFKFHCPIFVFSLCLVSVPIHINMFEMTACDDVSSVDCYNVQVNRQPTSSSLTIWFEPSSSSFTGAVNSQIKMSIIIRTAHNPNSKSEFLLVSSASLTHHAFHVLTLSFFFFL